MRIEYGSHIGLHLAARRARAEAIGELIATAFTWLLSFARKPRLGHAPRPHFAR